jgi:hypothetical protein
MKQVVTDISILIKFDDTGEFYKNCADISVYHEAYSSFRS